MTRTRFAEILLNVLNAVQFLLDPSIQWNGDGTCFKVMNEMQLLDTLRSPSIGLKCKVDFFYSYLF
jgi:hypothetical protein